MSIMAINKNNNKIMVKVVSNNKKISKNKLMIL